MNFRMLVVVRQLSLCWCSGLLFSSPLSPTCGRRLPFSKGRSCRIRDDEMTTRLAALFLTNDHGIEQVISELSSWLVW